MPFKTSNPMKYEKGYLTDQQVDAIIEVAKRNPRDYMLVLTLLKTGRRISEIVKGTNGYGIKPIDIDFESRNVTYNILKKNMRRKGEVAQGIPKVPPERRTLPINITLLAKLEEYIKMRNIKDTDFIFPITKERAGQIIRRLGDQAHIGKVDDHYLHPHHFRHTFAVRIMRSPIAKTEDLIELKNQLQHSDINMTMTYLRYGKTKARELIDSI